MADVIGSVTLSIEELRLEGIRPFERFDVARALGRELALLFAERGVPPGLSAGLAPAPGVVDPTGLAPAELGRSVARSIYEGWS